MKATIVMAAAAILGFACPEAADAQTSLAPTTTYGSPYDREREAADKRAETRKSTATKTGQQTDKK